MQRIRIATRRSALATAQGRIVADALCSRHQDVTTELVPVVTGGDRYRGPVAEAGGKGLFTAELEEMLRGGGADLAVHSAKDLPVEMSDDMVIAAVPPRADPRDVIVSRFGDVASLPHGAKVGTSSLRRRAQLLALRGDLEVVAIRGNVETRLQKVRGISDGATASLDAVILAAAGLDRIGLMESHSAHVSVLEVESFTPPTGQGALVVQVASSNTVAMELAASLDDPASRAALEAERSVVRALGADCHSCLAVYIFHFSGGVWRALAMAARSDGSDMIRSEAAGENACDAASVLLAEMDLRGVRRLLGY